MPKALRWIILVVSLLAIVAAIAVVVLKPESSGTKPAEHTVVRGLVGSEKAAFFADKAVQQAFSAAGYDLQIDTAGSKTMVTADPSKYDFLLPSSAPVADALHAHISGSRETAVFQTPVVIMTFEPVVTVLKSAGLASGSGDDLTFDLAAYLKTAGQGTRWNQVPGGAAIGGGTAIQVRTTDPMSSNSALMFASLTAYVANGDTVVSTPAQVKAVTPKVRPVFANQGYMESSSEGPFEDYLALGQQSTPMLLGYESQLLSRRLEKSPAVTSAMRVMYPSPGMFSKHVVVSRTDTGAKVANLLTHDQALLEREAQYGFHPIGDPEAFTSALAKAGVKVGTASAAVEPSKYEILDQLARAVSSNPEAADSAPAPTPITSGTP